MGLQTTKGEQLPAQSPKIRGKGLYMTKKSRDHAGGFSAVPEPNPHAVGRGVEGHVSSSFGGFFFNTLFPSEHFEYT